MIIDEPTCMRCGRLKKFPKGITYCGEIKLCECDEVIFPKLKGEDLF